MKISVTKTMNGAPDGVHTQTYVAGETYDMPDDLGAVFVREKWGTDVREPSERGEQKKAKGPAENK